MQCRKSCSPRELNALLLNFYCKCPYRGSIKFHLQKRLELSEGPAQHV